MKKQVMTIAWSIAKEAAAKHGGSSKQYLSEAMKQAWAQVQAPAVEEVAAVEVEVAVVEAAPTPKKKAAPKKKKATGGFGYWMTGIVENFQVPGVATVEAPKEPKQPVVRKFETAAEKRARRAANPEMYATPVKKTVKGNNFGAWMRGIDANM